MLLACVPVLCMPCPRGARGCCPVLHVCASGGCSCRASGGVDADTGAGVALMLTRLRTNETGNGDGGDTQRTGDDDDDDDEDDSYSASDGSMGQSASVASSFLDSARERADEEA